VEQTRKALSEKQRQELMATVIEGFPELKNLDQRNVEAILRSKSAFHESFEEFLRFPLSRLPSVSSITEITVPQKMEGEPLKRFDLADSGIFGNPDYVFDDYRMETLRFQYMSFPASWRPITTDRVKTWIEVSGYRSLSFKEIVAVALQFEQKIRDARFHLVGLGWPNYFKRPLIVWGGSHKQFELKLENDFDPPDLWDTHYMFLVSRLL
jgi:hypothetical protein